MVRRKSNPSPRHSFDRLPGPKLQRSRFRRPTRHITAIDAGYIYPVLVDEVLPGDTIKLNLTSICRLNTPLTPLMDNLYIDWHFFFVPSRLVWTNWVRFCGERPDPADDIDYLVPQVTAPTTTGFSAESLYDYFGIRAGVDGFNINNLIPRGYNLIWNEWFRHTWLQDRVPVDLDDGPDDPADYTLLKRCKRGDYFTQCLPSPQRGDAVMLPLGDSAPVIGIGVGDQTYTGGGLTPYQSDGSTSNMAFYKKIDPDLAAGHTYIEGQEISSTWYPNIRADLANATAATVNDIREAIQLQRILEKEARGGTRYTEILQNFWGVIPEDARLQRPEYLGGGSRPIEIQAVAQTSESNTTPQGTLVGVSYNQTHGIGFSKSFNEHGHVFGLASIRCDQTYQQGIRRMWTRRTRYDYPMPQTMNLGEMAVLNKEIFVQGDANDELVFGYAPHWDDYRYFPSMVTGKMRSDHASSLDPWHLAVDFASLPTLGSDFIKENPPLARAVAVPSEPMFYLDCFFDIVEARCMPMFGVPGMLDHF